MPYYARYRNVEEPNLKIPNFAKFDQRRNKDLHSLAVAQHFMAHKVRAKSIMT